MNLITQHLDKNNLHHAYLVEGISGEIVPEIFKYIEDLGIKTSNNPDFCHISIDFLKIKQALDLRAMGSLKGAIDSKKIFVISVNRFSKDAEGVLLKMFEEPIENTHFFIVIPDLNVLTKTLVSRFYLIKTKNNLENNLEEAKEFISLNLKDRLDFIKKFMLIAEKNDDEEDSEGGEEGSVRSKAFIFLDALEYVLHQKFITKKMFDNKVDYFDQIFKVREFMRQQGSSTKTLLESVALSIPIL